MKSTDIIIRGVPEMGHRIDMHQAVNAFNEDGFVKIGKLFEESEIEILKNIIHHSSNMNESVDKVRAKVDRGSYPSFETIFVMNDVLSESPFSLACRRPEILDFISEVFQSDAYLYHSKVPLKYPGMPGFKFHQDYYYWYQMGCVFPDMASCFIALDDATQKNGCLRVIPGSHKCGRIEHVMNDGISDSEADPLRVSYLLDTLGEVSLEVSSGEVFIFHCNTLHASSANISDKSRLALMGCYNVERNNPITNNPVHPKYSKQERFYGKLGD